MTNTVLITGSSRGIGKAIALRLAKSGFNIVLHYLSSRQKVEEVASEIHSLDKPARVLQFDISDRQATASAITTDINKYGAYYGVVCNAGLTRDNAFPSITGEDWDTVLRTNLDGFYNVIQPLIMPMIRRRKPGRIVTLSSVSGIMGNRGQTNYSAAKAGIIGASKALALEMAKRKITVNCVAPGFIDTDMLDLNMTAEQITQYIPMRRTGTVNEVASVVNFLMSDESSYITRQVLSVNGGIC